MGFIERKKRTVQVEDLQCSHPSVSRIWETGGLAAFPTNGQEVRRIHISLNIVKTFTDKGDGKAILEAEEFLSNLD